MAAATAAEENPRSPSPPLDEARSAEIWFSAAPFTAAPFSPASRRPAAGFCGSSSSWPHYESLDTLIGGSYSKPQTSAAASNGHHNRNLRRRHPSLPEISPSPSPSPEPATVSRKFSPEIHRRDKGFILINPTALILIGEGNEMAIAAARSVLRSSAARSAASRFGAQTKPARSPFRLPTGTPLAQRLSRSPVEMSACVVSLQPYHTATASALMMSMLTVSRCGFGWLPEGKFLVISFVVEEKKKNKLGEILQDSALYRMRIGSKLDDFLCQ